MINEKLVQSPECEDMCEDICEKMYEDMYEDHVCPHCSSQLQYGCVLNLKTGLIEQAWVCHDCGHMK